MLRKYRSPRALLQFSNVDVSYQFHEVIELKKQLLDPSVIAVLGTTYTGRNDRRTGYSIYE